jgi:ADP-ribosylglycohydrolase
VGDALGMPAEGRSRAEVARLWPHLAAFEPGAANAPVGRGLRAGSTTDDTAQAVLVARLLVEGGGHVDPRRLATELLAWERRQRAGGAHGLLGPSTRRALSAVAAGADPATTGRTGDTNGAAMRVAGVGVAVPPEPLAALVDAVEEAGRATHDTSVAHAGASAVAAAVSAGVDGAGLRDALALAVAAAREGAHRGAWWPGADVAARIEWAVGLVRGAPTTDAALDVVDRLVGTGLATQESVPAALAVATLHPEDAWATGLAAASLGGDADTVAAMACAVVAACGAALPEAAVATVRDVNGLDLDPLADALLALRGPR